MKISWSKIYKTSDGQEFYVWDEDNNSKLLGIAIKPNGSNSWTLNEELQRVFPYMAVITNYKAARGLRQKLKTEAEKMTSRQATVRYLGPEEFLDPRPERGLERFTTTELWAELKHRVLPIVNLDDEDEMIPWLQKIIAEAQPLPDPGDTP